MLETKSAKLHVEPSELSWQQSISISLKQLFPGEVVEFRASSKDEKGRDWASKASFKANQEGIIDLETQRPVSGSYRDKDVRGLFWSMSLQGDQKDGSYYFHKSLSPMIVNLSIKRESGEILSKEIILKPIKNPLKRMSVQDEGVVGELFLPEGKGPFHTVVTLSGASQGMLYDAFVAQFADQGYATLSLAYHGLPGLPSLRDVPIETLSKAISWVKKQSILNSEELAVVGYSMGGVFALLAASYFPEIKKVISLSGRCVLPQGLNLDEPYSVFTYQGKPFPYLQLKKQKNPSPIPMFFKALSELDEKEIEALTIPVEKIQGSVLMICGLDDARVPTTLLCSIGYRRLVAHQFHYPFDIISYKGAGHAIGEVSLPYLPTTSLNVYSSTGEFMYHWGGNAKDQAFANIDMWKKMFEFLASSNQ